MKKGDLQAFEIRVIPDWPGSLFSIANTPTLSSNSSQTLLLVFKVHGRSWGLQQPRPPVIKTSGIEKYDDRTRIVDVLSGGKRVA